MNIWCISKYALPPEFGVQHRLFKLAKWLNRAGENAVVISSSTNHLASTLPKQNVAVRNEIIDGVESYFLRGIPFNKANSYQRVISWIYFEWQIWSFTKRIQSLNVPRPDVVLVSSLSLFTIINGIRIKRRYGAKFVLEIRDIWPLTAILIAKVPRWHPLMLLMRQVERLGYKHADLISSPLPNLPAHISRSINKNFLFHYSPQGLDFESFKYAPKFSCSEDFLNQYISRDHFNVVYIGNIVTAYDLESLIGLARWTEHRERQIRFIILGDGDYKLQLMAMAKDLTNVIFAPRIPKNEVNSFLERCQLATNFLRSEALFEFGVSPQKIIDYFQARIPVLMSYTGYPSLVEQAKAGFEVEAGNIELLGQKLLQLFTMDKDTLRQMGENGYRFLENNLDWRIIALRYAESIRQLNKQG